MKAVIIDDEPDSRETLRLLLETYCEGVSVEGMAQSALSGIDLIKRIEPDLVFLDISMPGKDGFYVMEQFRDPDFEVIFVTAYDHYAIQAIRLAALDYLLKPVDIVYLRKAIEKAREKMKQKQRLDQLDVLISNLKGGSKPAKIAIPTAMGFEYVNIRQIVRCEAEGGYTRFHMDDGQNQLVSRNLGEYEELLEPYGFFRIHHSHLINLDHVRSYEKGRGGHVKMTDNHVLEVAQRKKAEFIEKFETGR